MTRSNQTNLFLPEKKILYQHSVCMIQLSGLSPRPNDTAHMQLQWWLLTEQLSIFNTCTFVFTIVHKTNGWSHLLTGPRNDAAVTLLQDNVCVRPKINGRSYITMETLIPAIACFLILTVCQWDNIVKVHLWFLPTKWRSPKTVGKRNKVKWEAFVLKNPMNCSWKNWITGWTLVNTEPGRCQEHFFKACTNQ